MVPAQPAAAPPVPLSNGAHNPFNTMPPPVAVMPPMSAIPIPPQGGPYSVPVPPPSAYAQPPPAPLGYDSRGPLYGGPPPGWNAPLPPPMPAFAQHLPPDQRVCKHLPVIGLSYISSLRLWSWLPLQ